MRNILNPSFLLLGMFCKIGNSKFDNDYKMKIEVYDFFTITCMKSQMEEQNIRKFFNIKLGKVKKNLLKLEM